MAHRYLMDALNRTLEDLAGSPGIMGSKVFIAGGDKRQILPVVPRGGEAEILNATVARSPLWGSFRTYPLTVNMRVPRGLASPRQQDFAAFLLEVGNGTALTDSDGKIDIPF